MTKKIVDVYAVVNQRDGLAIICAQATEGSLNFRLQNNKQGWGYRTIIAKRHIDLTPAAAYERYVATCERQVEQAASQLEYAKHGLALAQASAEALLGAAAQAI